MSNIRAYMPFSPVSFAIGLVAVLGIAYMALIAVVMSYAALTVEFSQSVRNDEATVAVLESKYLSSVSEITSIDYIAAGYAQPINKLFVQVKNATALR